MKMKERISFTERNLDLRRERVAKSNNEFNCNANLKE